MLSIPGKRILVVPFTEDTKIILTRSQPDKYKVVYIGKEVTEVAIGDLVYLTKYSGHEFTHNNEKLLVYNQDDVIAKIS